MNDFYWKGNKKCAVAITVNLNGEYFWLSMFPDCHNKPKTLSLGTFGIDTGLPRILDIFEEYNIKSTFFVPGAIIEKYSEKIKMIVRNNHEIANHGYLHENFALKNKEEQKDALIKSNELIKSITGKYPTGFRAPEGEITQTTYELLEEFNFIYDSSLMDDYLPYSLKLNNKKYNIIQLPIQWQLYDFPYFAFNYSPAFPSGQGRISSYSSVLSNWIYEFDGYRNNHLAYILQIDPQTMGTPGRVLMLKKFIDYVIATNDAWFCTCNEMAIYYKENLRQFDGDDDESEN
jgi:peptidoglycan/xylan/chitin deacetylase (PgdA/CDA1 family)